MFKLSEAADLEKAGHSIGSFFAKRAEELEKNYTFHKAMGQHHDSMSKAHTAHAADTQAHHDGLDNAHDMKAHLAKTAAHHVAMAAHHDAVAKAHHAHADTMKADVDAMKILASDWGGPAVKAANGTALSTTGDGSGGNMNVAAMLQQTSEALMKKTLDSFNTDPEVAETIRQYALKQINSVLGDKLVPDNIRGITPNFPHPVPRAGQRPIEKPEVPLEFEKLVSIEDDVR